MAGSLAYSISIAIYLYTCTSNSNSSSIASWIYPVHHPVQYAIIYLVLYLYQVLYLVLYLILYLTLYLGLYPALALALTYISITSLYNYTYMTSNIRKMFQQKGWFQAADGPRHFMCKVRVNTVLADGLALRSSPACLRDRHSSAWVHIPLVQEFPLRIPNDELVLNTLNHGRENITAAILLLSDVMSRRLNICNLSSWLNRSIMRPLIEITHWVHHKHPELTFCVLRLTLRIPTAQDDFCGAKLLRC